ncbi:ParB/RepB/Spo0J family partition protein [Slackia isoflavoniconvertens]|uniref:ParB/RepB/Spo0J family partition protein n=1 Tax=Slackia isoflavoniconvertens TaxID=572010 RepID=UPI002E765792|nr:ParB/RepB/Spo0J family partition protein [Slackia isoflavoniconvertens]
MAKNKKAGLGRGLNSLLGGYEAPAEPARVAPERQVERVETQAASVAEPALAAPAPVVEREVIREEDLAPEDRETLDGEKYSTPKQYAKPTVATEPLSSRIAVKDVVAKTELIEEPDGVTIKSVTERPATPAARYMEEVNRPSALDARLMQREVASAPQATVPAPQATASAATQAQPQVETAGAPESSAEAALHHLDEVPIELVHPNPNQPRMHFNKEELDELALSIEKDGLLQPILVREDAEGYEIIAGERRWQASQLAGLKKVPVRIKEADDMKVLELALIENLQRSDLNPIEEAYGYKRMMERGNRTQSEVASAVSKGRSTIANALRLLDLPEDAQQMLYEEKITAGHARAILAIPSDEGRAKLTEKLAKEKLSVREAESLARLIAGREKQKNNPVKKPPKPRFFRRAAKDLSESFDTKVQVRSVNGKNKIEIEFKDEEDLHRLYDLMKHSAE